MYAATNETAISGGQLVNNPLFSTYGDSTWTFGWSLTGSKIAAENNLNGTRLRIGAGPSYPSNNWSTASQSISGLVVGRQYLLSINYINYLRNGATPDCAFSASIGATPLFNYSNTMFTGLMPISVVFVASATTQLLSLSAYNTYTFFYVSNVTLYMYGSSIPSASGSGASPTTASASSSPTAGASGLSVQTIIIIAAVVGGTVALALAIAAAVGLRRCHIRHTALPPSTTSPAAPAEVAVGSAGVTAPFVNVSIAKQDYNPEAGDLAEADEGPRAEESTLLMMFAML